MTSGKSWRLPAPNPANRQANTLSKNSFCMALQMECPECEDHREFVKDNDPTEDNFSREAEDIPRINLKCEDCGHEIRLWDSDITTLFL